ncbi:MAG: S-methyl-5-thioribose-1-phosphate isomerase [Desulfurococcaceae archaeon]
MNSYKYPLKVRAVWWNSDKKELCWINTLKLPFTVETVCSNDIDRIVKAIVNMEIRGAPAIGVAAALAVAAHAHRISSLNIECFYDEIEKAISKLWRTRPTAYNLFWALSRLRNIIVKAKNNGLTQEEVVELIEREALNILNEDIEANIRIGEYGQELVPSNATILTHCNAGALATAGFGTALSIIRIAHYLGKNISVVATETRPVLQGARLTTWELWIEGIPVKLITDNMVGYIMRKRLVDLVVVGADRITRDGYVVNKIGTYMIALCAKRNNIPFYVAAPITTIDINSTINDIVIEERVEDEVKKISGYSITLDDIPALNYAFDITDPDLVTAIITDRGIVKPPFSENLVKIVDERIN